MKSSMRKIILFWIQERINHLPDISLFCLQFFTVHKSLHKYFMKFSKTKLCIIIITSICRQAIKRYNNFNLENALQWLKNIRNYSEDTEINILNEVYNNLTNQKSLNWLMELLNEFDAEQKVKILKRILYNIVFNGLNRKIIKNRLKNNSNFVPNLSAIFLSTTNKCDLNCRGCESASDRNNGEVTFAKLDYVINQAKRLNIFHVVIVGKGEPFYDNTSKNILFKLIEKHWDLNFILFTNGTTLKEQDLYEMRNLDNLLNFISIDGLELINDGRRGTGVYKKIMKTFELMKINKLLYGFSATVFKDNYQHILSEIFLSKMIEIGCKFGIYLNFLPINENVDRMMILNNNDIHEYQKRYHEVKNKITIPIIDPEIFEQMNGCRAKRGSVVYIDAVDGKVMPCVKTPFAPDESNIYLNPHKNRLLEILKTDFFADYRNSYTKCSQCSSNLSKELVHFLENREISDKDKKRVEQYLRKVIL